MARCVLWAHKLRLFCPHHLLIRLRLNGYSIFLLGLRSNRRDWLAIDNRYVVGSFLLADFSVADSDFHAVSKSGFGVVRDSSLELTLHQASYFVLSQMILKRYFG